MYFTFCSLLFAYLLFFKICEIKIKGKRRIKRRGRGNGREEMGERGNWGERKLGLKEKERGNGD